MMAGANMNDPAVKLAVHEAVCAERYKNLMARMGRLEKIVLGAAASLLLGMAGALWQLAHIGG